MSASRRVLVVEDNPALRKLICRQLVRKGFQVTDASSGENVLSLVRESRPNVILLDMNLPGKSGWTVAREMRSKELTGRIPIIAITAHAMQGDRERAIEAGCDAYVSKPINFKLLVERIHDFLGPSDE